MAGSSAPAERVSSSDANTDDLRALANSIPDDTFDFDFDDEPEAGSAAERQAREAPAHATAEEAAEETEEAREALPSEDITDEDMGEEPEEDATEVKEPDDGEDEAKEAAKADEEAKPVTIKIGGVDRTPEEIERGFLRQDDYTRKTQELAETKRQVEGYQQRLQQSEGELATVLDLATEITRASLPQPPDNRLIETDPQAFLRQKTRYDAEIQKVQKLVEARQTLGHQQTEQQRAQTEAQRAQSEQEQQARAQQAQAALQNEFRLMQEKIPELRTPEGRNTFAAEAAKYGAVHGISPERIAAIQDHQMLLVLKDAMELRRLKAATPTAVQKAKTAPPIRPATRPPGTRDDGGRRAAIERFHRDPSIKNAAATIPDSWLE